MRRSNRSFLGSNGRTLLASVLGASAAGLALLPSGVASAQLNIKIRQPNVLLVMDNSASMAFAPDGSAADCQSGEPSRWFIATEALTGTVADGWCHSEGSLSSAEDFTGATSSTKNTFIAFGDDSGGGPGNHKVCVAAPRRSTSPWSLSDSKPGSWYGSSFGSSSKRSQAIIYRRLEKADSTAIDWESSSTCTFDQSNDGAIDAFKDRLRFGMATVDPLKNLGLFGIPLAETYNSKSSVSNYPSTYFFDPRDWLPTRQTWEESPFDYGFSYWYASGSHSNTSTWGSGTRFGLYPSTHLDLTVNSVLPLPVCPDPLTPTVGCVDNFDAGIRNSYAAPWNGRLIGFGEPDASTADTLKHNGMLELAMQATGPWQRGSTPLAAMMRDVHEFMRNDTQSVGAQYPGDDDYDSHKLGPETDADYVVGGCRDQAVVVVSDGSQYRDLDARPGDYANDLYLDHSGSRQKVSTYVVGVGATTFNWAGTDYPCELLRDTDFAPGGVCAPGTTTHFENTGTPPGALESCCTLAEIAYKGGDPAEVDKRLFFADSSNDARTKLLQIMGDIAGVTISRTVPVFARSTGIAPSATAPAASYEIFSALQVTTTGGPWKGVLHRLRNVCDAAGALSTDNITATSTVGDRFEDNILNTTVRKRKMFTAVSLDDPDQKDGSRKSLRDNSTSYDGRDGLDGRKFAQTDLVEPQDLAGEVSLKWGGGKISSFLNIDTKNSTLKECVNVFGSVISGSPTTKADLCAGKVLEWLGGMDVGLSDGRHGLGAIWRSNPIIVTPPQPTISDESFSADVRTGSNASNDSYVVQQKERPTMAYVQTIDGLLHAFVVQRNKVDGTGTHPEYFTDVPPADTDDNNELWSFIPPAVVTQLWPNFDKHARLLDGPVVVRDVAWRRTQTDRQDDQADWHSVLLASGGFAAAGGFYYAIDVTNPTDPKFLWQLSREGNLDPLFGDVLPGGAITTLRVKNSSGNTELVPVAILPGGQPNSPSPSGTIDRGSWSPGTGTPSGWKTSNWAGANKPRQKILNWDTEQRSRSLTIVDLKTGEILGRMVGQSGDQYSTINSGVYIPLNNSHFDSPMSGAPVPFPDYPGQPASRAYIGDVDGTMWRVDLTSNDPKKWEAQISWDAYNADSLKNALDEVNGQAALNLTPSATEMATMGQPIQLDPLISVDDKGDPVVMFATGDQEQFQAGSPGMVNFTVSYSDPFVVAPAFTPTLLTDVGYTDGVRVTGPLTLFDGNLYMSYFKPNGTGSCVLGSSGWCAFDYVDSAREGQGTPGDGHADAVTNVDGDGTFDATDVCAPLGSAQLVFGMSLFQQPSCEQTPADFGDSWFGGNYSAYSTTSAGSYQLIMHTSESGGGSEDITISTDSKTLSAPKTTTRVVSWTNVVE